MESLPLEYLRNDFAKSIIATMATQVATYMRLTAHPDVQFGDFLDALARNAVIADDAARRLHRRLNLPSASGSPVIQRSYWMQVLAERGIPLNAPFVARTQTTSPAATPVPAPAPAATQAPAPASTSTAATVAETNAT